MKKGILKRLVSLVAALTLALGMVGGAAAESADKSVNIAVTDTIGTLNPLLMGAMEVMKYANSLVFLPLVELNQDLEFVPQLAESITTEDNRTFTIKLQQAATWSDGVPVTAKDVAFTLLCLASPGSFNAGMAMYAIEGTDDAGMVESGATEISGVKIIDDKTLTVTTKWPLALYTFENNYGAIEGTDDAGMVESGATEISGVKIIDDKTLTVTTKWPLALYTFENNYGRYVLTLPEHILGSVPKEELLTYDWFNHADVISGPYFVKNFDLNHYVHYEANPNYWMGEAKIKYLNMNVVDSAQLLTGLQAGEIDLVQQTTGNVLLEDYESIRALSNVTVYLNMNVVDSAQLLTGLQAGEIDLVQQTTGNVLLEDYESIRALSNVTVHMGTPVTNQSIFFNVERVPDVRIRQALLCGMDRETIFNELVHGNGEIVDGFLCSASPYYDAALGVTPFDPEKAAQLIQEAVADGASNQLSWYVNNGDATFIQAASFIAAMFQELGLQIDVKMVDLNTLMDIANKGEFDVMSVQYTYAPVDPYTDVSWLLSKDGWTRYTNEEISAALVESQSLNDVEEIRARYLMVDQRMQQDVPMISAYVISTMGVTSNRLLHAEPDVFGTFINVTEWDIAQ